MASAENSTTDLATLVDDALDKAEVGSVLWSIAYNGSGIASILASAGAAFIAAAKLSTLPGTAAAWIAALSGSAATLTAVSTFTGCARKWRANRTTRMNLRLLKLDLPNGEPDKLRDRFSRIMREHEHGILGADAE